MLNPLEKKILADMISQLTECPGMITSISDNLASQFVANWNFPDGIEFIHETHGCLCCMVNIGSLFKGADLVLDKPRRPRSKKPNEALLNRIRNSITSSMNDQDEVKKASDASQSDKEKKPKKKARNQGKLKTFKRKSKKPGRI